MISIDILTFVFLIINLIFICVVVILLIKLLIHVKKYNNKK